MREKQPENRAPGECIQSTLSPAFSLTSILLLVFEIIMASSTSDSMIDSGNFIYLLCELQVRLNHTGI